MEKQSQEQLGAKMALLKIAGSVKLYSYHGVTCSEDTWLLWRHMESLGCCLWCNKPVQKRYNNLNKHLRTCPARATLPIIAVDPMQVSS
jgi:hypothetical protein